MGPRGRKPFFMSWLPHHLSEEAKKPGQMPIIKPRWPTFKELTDEHDRRIKLRGKRI
jgi:hypothetical protein